MIFIPLVILILNEIIKISIHSLKNNKFQIRLFFHPGGMPSGHTAFASSVATLAYYMEGLQSIEFLIAFSLAIIVMYDARGLRATVEKHAKVINKMSNKIKLDESVGHTNFQVIIGALFGSISTFILIKIIETNF